MNQASRIGILGGTLDPIHLGHLDAALAAREALRLDRVVFIPTHVPPHRSRPVTSGFHRFAMAALAVSDQDGLLVDEIELLAPGPSYTADTLSRVSREWKLEASQIFFITGADAFAEIETWSRYPDVLALANFVVVARPGAPIAPLRARLPYLKDRMRLPRAAEPNRAENAAETLIFLVDAPTTDVSSTAIRQRIAQRRPFSGLVPPAVEHHIQRHALYDSPTSISTRADHLHGQD